MRLFSSLLYFLHEQRSEVYYGQLSFFRSVYNSQNMRSLAKYALQFVYSTLLPVKKFFHVVYFQASFLVLNKLSDTYLKF